MPGRSGSDPVAPNVRALHAYWLARRAKDTQSLARQARPSLASFNESSCERLSVPYNGRRSKESDNGRISSNQ
jgi:hypothetical protein